MLGLQVIAGYSGAPVLGGEGLIIWGDQPICCRDAGTTGLSFLDVPRRASGSSRTGV